MLDGISPNGEHYYPAFPYTSFTHMRPEDVRDLMAYLRTLPPVARRPPPHELSFPFNVRLFLAFWKMMFFAPGTLEDDAARDADWNRGRYLVEGATHCAECHSSRNLLGAIRAEARFAGGPDPEGVGFVPNITPGRIGDWSEDELVELLTSGRTARGTHVGSTMASVVSNTAKLPPEDRRAIAVYLKSLPARPTPAP
jgi:mono/diheme cytochrome c family protein